MVRNSDNDDGAERRETRGIDADRRTFMKTVGATVGAGLLGAGVDSAAASVGDLAARSDATHVATTSGRWADASTWNTGTTPGDDATVWIDDGVTVTLDHRDDARLFWVFAAGTLRFDPNTDTALQVDTLLTGESSTLEIGTAANPVAAANTAEVTFVDRGPIDETWDPERKSRGLLPMGEVSIHGAETTAHTTLAQHPRAGDGQLELSSAPTNWSAGDSLVVPGVSPAENQDEEVTVASVSGSTVSLQETLQYDHVPPAADLDAYALDLARNVRFRSESTEIDRRAHAMIMGTGSTIEYAGFYEMGRTDKSVPVSDPPYNEDEIRSDGVFDLAPNDNRNARYSLHYHKTGPRRSVEPHEATGCVVAPKLDGSGWKGSPGWGFTNHQSHANVRDSITYKVYGTGFMTETGVEIGTFENNFALRSEGSGKDPDWREFIAWADHANRALIDDFGHNGVGFWLEGPLVSVTNNVAAGQRNFGIAYWNRALGDYVPDEVGDPDVAPSKLDRELVEADIGRHRGTIPNVPASYADDKPTEANNVGPDSAGPSVDEFAHATYTAADGTTFVDEGSIPIHNEGNTVFASGSGIEVMNHMQGAGQAIYGETEYYGLVKDFTAFNIGARADESDLPHTDINPDGSLNFQFPRGTGIGLGIRYASHVRVENPRLVGDGTGVGITHNMRAEGMVVENADIENWGSGIGCLTNGLTEIRDPTFTDIAKAEINIKGEQILAGEPTTRLWNVDAGDEIYMDPSSDVGTDWNREYWLDDRQVYFESAAPADAVDDPRLTGGLIEPGSGGGDTTAPSAPSNLTVTGTTESAIDLSWDAATDDTGVDSYVVTVDGATQTVPAGTTTATVDGLASGTTYDCAVTAVEGAGNESGAATVSATTDGGDAGGSGTAINVGGDAVTVDGTDFAADAHVSGGTVAGTGDPISGGSDALYGTNRWGSSITADVPVADGSYDVTLHFVEDYWESDGSRVFDVAVEGETVASGLDVHAEVGHDVAHTESVGGVAPSDGTITIDLTGTTDNAVLNGIEIAPASSGSGGDAGTVETAINCGDGSAHTTADGVTYAADAHYTGGAADAADRTIAGTDEDGLYDSNRWGAAMRYDVPVGDASATYDVTLHFAETYWSSAGSRVFDVLVEGTTELAGFDPYAAAAGRTTAVSRTVTGVSPSNGTVSIDFAAQVDNPMLSGIEVVRR